MLQEDGLNRVCMDLADATAQLTAYLNGLNDPKLEMLCPLAYRMVAAPTEFAVRFERILGSMQPTEIGDPTRIHPCRQFEDWDRTHSSGDEKFLGPVYALREYVARSFSRSEILGFFMHGSVSTHDYVPGYSDLDTLVVVRRAVLRDPVWLADFKRRLARSTRYLFFLDPLQHHGHFVLTEYNLEAYDEALFPLVLFGHSTELSDFRAVLEFSVLRSSSLLHHWKKTLDYVCAGARGGSTSAHRIR